MPRKKRDYKAEYARRKAIASSHGYTVRQERYVRKRLGLPRTFKTIERKFLPDNVYDTVSGRERTQLDKESEAWSKAHSHGKYSKFRKNMSAQQKRDYKKAFVDRPRKGSRKRMNREKRLAIIEYLEKYYPGEQDWGQKYKLAGD